MAATRFVLDEPVAGRSLVIELRRRGFEVSTLHELGVAGQPDPDVVRTVDERLPGMWVLVTMDLSLIEDHPQFDWTRYAIAWVQVRPELRGAAVDEAKNDIVHDHARSMVRQGRGDHFTYRQGRRDRHPPGVLS